MGLKYIKTFTSDCRLGLWEIEEDLNTLHNMISLEPEEEKTIRGYGNEARKAEYLSVRVLLHRMLNGDARIRYGTRNKPFLAGKDYDISISHSGRYTAILLSREQRVGVDLEKMSHRISKIADRFINPSERITADPSVKRYHLYIHWCAKEALYKLLDKKGLNFREHIIIQPFVPKDEGQLSGHVKNETIDESFDLWYYRLVDYVIVWSCKDKMQ
ncbi:MAG: 4'-phosphopantetheinyl transferase superfamily protein [Chlorobi bacterium]|nr:4'-phosphopantetheinyl transferase superfamily protein [Chlorobiota bacterium]